VRGCLDAAFSWPALQCRIRLRAHTSELCQRRSRLQCSRCQPRVCINLLSVHKAAGAIAMPEVTEEQKSGPIDVQHYLDLIRRRHIQFLIPFFLGWAMVWGASWILPVSYKSGTLILVQQPTMPKDYVVPNISDNLQDRLQSITQQILSRTRLLL